MFLWFAKIFLSVRRVSEYVASVHAHVSYTKLICSSFSSYCAFFSISERCFFFVSTIQHELDNTATITNVCVFFLFRTKIKRSETRSSLDGMMRKNPFFRHQIFFVLQLVSISLLLFHFFFVYRWPAHRLWVQNSLSYRYSGTPTHKYICRCTYEVYEDCSINSKCEGEKWQKSTISSTLTIIYSSMCRWYRIGGYGDECTHAHRSPNMFKAPSIPVSCLLLFFYSNSFKLRLIHQIFTFIFRN